MSKLETMEVIDEDFEFILAWWTGSPPSLNQDEDLLVNVSNLQVTPMMFMSFSVNRRNYDWSTTYGDYRLVDHPGRLIGLHVNLNDLKVITGFRVNFRGLRIITYGIVVTNSFMSNFNGLATNLRCSTLWTHIVGILVLNLGDLQVNLINLSFSMTLTKLWFLCP